MAIAILVLAGATWWLGRSCAGRIGSELTFWSLFGGPGLGQHSSILSPLSSLVLSSSPLHPPPLFFSSLFLVFFLSFPFSGLPFFYASVSLFPSFPYLSPSSSFSPPLPTLFPLFFRPPVSPRTPEESRAIQREKSLLRLDSWGARGCRGCSGHVSASRAL